MPNRKPKHIGIIPDGNRRWAKEHEMEKQEGYNYGLAPALNLLHLAQTEGIEEITYYGFTVDNCKRPTVQFQAFQTACVKAVKLLEKENVDIFVIGNTNSSCFPKELIPYTIHKPHHKHKIRVNLLVNYGWKWDLSHISTDGIPYSSEISRIDLIIRWGGMRRLSGFLPIQSVYSDFYIVDRYWPDFQPEDFQQALNWYSRQDVTLGG